jgi:hypothetical protein
MVEVTVKFLPYLMKLIYLLFAAALFTIPACEKRSHTLKDKVNDALDRRPAEKTRDAVEDVSDAIEDVAK